MKAVYLRLKRPSSRFIHPVRHNSSPKRNRCSPSSPADHGWRGKLSKLGVPIEEKGISVELINIHTTVLPDEEAALKSIQTKMRGDCQGQYHCDGETALHKWRSRHFPVPIEYIGTKDTFGESNTRSLPDEVWFDALNIIEAVEKVSK